MSMGVYIKNMEMPKNCYGCPFFKQVDYYNKNDEADILSKCKRTGEFTWESVNGYLSNCPLIPIPPHGDLIDRDKIAYFKDDSNLVDFDYAYRSQINSMPTIIPADEPKEES